MMDIIGLAQEGREGGIQEGRPGQLLALRPWAVTSNDIIRSWQRKADPAKSRCHREGPGPTLSKTDPFKDSNTPS